jgi:hypothetical protein
MRVYPDVQAALQAILYCVVEGKRAISVMDPVCILECLKAIGPVTVALAVFIATCWFYRWQIRLAKQNSVTTCMTGGSLFTSPFGNSY